MLYDELLIEVEEEGIKIYENNRIGKLEGLYVNNTITLNTSLANDTQRKCILAEELGHYHTTVGNILDQSKVENRKQERLARAWGYERLISILDFINAHKEGIRNRYELAEYLKVTEDFLEDTIEHYKRKYGLFCKIGNYVVYFSPLSVLEVFD